MSARRRCGNCTWYSKLSIPYSSLPGRDGLCDKFDWLSHPDGGKDCTSFKGKKYNRIIAVKQAEKEAA